MACLILKATCKWPQEFGHRLLKEYQDVKEEFLVQVNERLKDVYPAEPQPDCSSGSCPHPQRHRCLEDGCSNPSSCHHEKIGLRDHTNVQPRRDVWAYLWARTVQCQACNGMIPLSPNWRLDDQGTGIKLEPDGNDYHFRIIHDRGKCPDCRRKDFRRPCNTATLHPDGEISAGTQSKAIAILPSSHVRDYYSERVLGERSPSGEDGTSVLRDRI